MEGTTYEDEGCSKVEDGYDGEMSTENIV